jgi:hypothetical protein
MNLSDIINKSLIKINEQLGEPVFIWQSEEYPCIPSSTGKALTLEDGGFAVEADLVLTVRTELFETNYPSAQQKVTYKDIVYRIITVRKDVSDTFLRLFCENPSRGV